MGGTGSGGNRAKPLEYLKATDRYSEARHGGLSNMSAPRGVPDAPDDLDGDALAEWNKMVARLDKCGGLSTVDDSVIYHYAKMYAETKIIEHGLMPMHKLAIKMEKSMARLEGMDLTDAMHAIVGLRRNIMTQVAHLRQNRMALRQYLAELGMTPAARGRVHLPPDRSEPGGKLMSFRGGKA